MAGTIKGIIVEIGGDTSGLQTALSKVNSATSSLSKELKGINSLLKLDPSNTELLAQKQEVLSEEIEKTSEKLKLLKEAQEDADETILSGGEINQENYRNLQREIASTENKLKTLQNQASDWTQAGEQLEEYGTKIESLGSKISKIGNKLTVLSTAVLAVGTYAVSSAIEFESAFTGVEKTVDATDEQLEELKQGIKDLAEEVPATTTEIAAVAEAAGQLGIATEDILDFTKVMIDLGESTNLSADEAASALAKFANITGTAAEDYSKLGSVIVDLGNNFATTEADIVDMATNLAASGELAGLTEPQIFALATAMSSVGIEAEAGGTSMSKLLRQIQTAVETGSDSLEDFASVAGMTSKEFSKAFEEDAVEALSAFIKGLNDTERNGKTATVILQEMGITETRLTNTILSLANSSDVMTDAIETANSAWEENTALTNEANKRYATTESQIQMVKNKFSNLVTEIGNQLLPIVDKLLDKASDLIESFEDMTDEEQQNIIKTGLLVVAIGPLVKILGTVTTTAGKVVKGLGTLAQAIGSVTTGATSSSAAVNTLAKVISGLTSPVGLAVTGIAALTAAYYAYAKSIWSVAEEAKELRDSVEEEVQAREELIAMQQESLNSNLSEIDNIQSLRNELSSLVDENGNVQAGYEKRVAFILNELNSALGTEYELNGNIISSYQELQDSIDLTIKKKKAEIILAAEEEAYTTAIENQADAYETLNELLDKQKELQTEIGQTTGSAQAAAKAALQNTNIAIAEQKELIAGYATDIAKYEADSAAIISGSEEEIQKVIERTTYSYVDSTATIDEQINQQIQTEVEKLNTYRELYQQQVAANNEANAEIYQTQIEAQQSTLDNLATTLVEATTEVNELTPALTEAWQTLADSNLSAYQTALSQVSPSLQAEIENATGIVNSESLLITAFGGLGTRGLEAFKSQIESMSDTVSDEVEDTYSLAEQDTTMNETGLLLGNNVYSGFTSSNLNSRTLFTFGSTIASSFSSGFSSNLLINSPSKLFKKYGDFVEEGFEDGNPAKDYKRLAEKNAEAFVSGFDSLPNITEKLLQSDKLFDVDLDSIARKTGALTNNVIDGTKAISNNFKIEFNVQELDKARLDQCFEYVNRKFGVQYS